VSSFFFAEILFNKINDIIFQRNIVGDWVEVAQTFEDFQTLDKWKWLPVKLKVFLAYLLNDFFFCCYTTWWCIMDSFLKWHEKICGSLDVSSESVLE
jgi:hypothetical protein